jgi:hypothetical protein
MDYTDQLKRMHNDWSYEHLLRCNRYCKLYVDQHQDIATAVCNYRQAFMNKVA